MPVTSRTHLIGMGCATLLGLGVLICSGSIFWLNQATRSMVNQTGRAGLIADLQATGLTPATQNHIVAQIDQVLANYHAGRIGHAAIIHLFDRLATDSIYQAALLRDAPQQIATAHRLSDAEKQAVLMILAQLERQRLDAAMTSTLTPTPTAHDTWQRVTSRLFERNDVGRLRWQATPAWRDALAQAQTLSQSPTLPSDTPPIEADYITAFTALIDRALTENPRKPVGP